MLPGKWRNGDCVTMDQIRTALHASGSAVYIDLTYMIERKAAKDKLYAAALEMWLNKGGTVLLRDEIIRPHRSSSFFAILELERPCPFANAVASMDSAWLFVRECVK